jgi:hypothetical protein
MANDGGKLVQEIGSVLARRDLDEAGAIACHFALGKICDDQRDFATAFRHYDAANRLERRHARFDRAAHARAVDAAIKTFTTDFFASRAALGSASSRPVFIIGMPRSGTTLVEQILARHSRVFGAGELEFWMRQYARLGVSSIVQLDRDRSSALAAAYLAELEGLDASADFVTDKMPHNFLCLGLVHLVFPSARIVHCRRNPVDTCLSIYFQKFTRAHGYASDLDDLAFYYREYLRLMDHWRAVLPSAILHEVRYEDLVTHQEATSRALLAELEWTWEDRCLDFHSSDRRVATPSDWQVRQPIYRDSLDRWRRYAPYIAPLLPLADDYESGDRHEAPGPQ